MDRSQADTLREYVQYTLAEINLVVLSCICQSAKLTSPPIFHAISYGITYYIGLAYSVSLSQGHHTGWLLSADVFQSIRRGGRMHVHVHVYTCVHVHTLGMSGVHLCNQSQVT